MQLRGLGAILSDRKMVQVAIARARAVSKRCTPLSCDLCYEYCTALIFTQENQPGGQRK